MKKEFSTKWISSKQPRKQRKYAAKAPLHIKKNFMSVNLSKDLRKKYGKRNTQVKKGDTVKILRGKFSDKQGKILSASIKRNFVIVEGIQRKKTDGTKVDIKMQPSKLQIISLNLDTKRKGIDEVKKSEPKKNAEQVVSDKSEPKELKEKKTQESIQKKENKMETKK
jgi:large subunit ribosomal protein L24